MAPFVVVSPTNAKSLSHLRRLLMGTSCHVIVERKAATTWENAHYVARIIRKKNFRSVILVTSWWHMPRSYFLLRMSLLGAKVTILPCGVGKGVFSFKTLFAGPRWLLMEFGKLWASLGEAFLKSMGLVAMGKKRL